MASWRGRARPVKIAVVLAGVANLVVAGILIGTTGFRATLDPVPDRAVDRTPRPAAALSRSPAATPVSSSPVPVTQAPSSPVPVPQAPLVSPTTPSPATTPVLAAPATSAPAATRSPAAPGEIRPQGAHVTRTRGARPRSDRPRVVRPRKTSVVTRHTSDSLVSGPTTPAASAGGTPTNSPQVSGDGAVEGNGAG
ncbi:hypothetical protein EDD27_1963 [Nonomuraea polychroma]|uniref:Uncharacterized protein n=1 Tax=Nonomuraea polychroma TaxID=46176 RepID=A0A438M1H7_9ACTN|nr:hypothetical protein [Nonomuraea polychroma]RVX39602.1 hypothetical protein EDD27_1963 [Nonomuraea polychroma]